VAERRTNGSGSPVKAAQRPAARQPSPRQPSRHKPAARQAARRRPTRVRPPSGERPTRGSTVANGLVHTPARLWSALGVMAFVLSLFAARLIQLQGIDENDYARMAMQTGAKTLPLQAPRAPIYDRKGVELAETVDAAMLVADPSMVKDPEAIATRLQRRLGVDYIATLELLKKKSTRYVELARSLPDKQAEAVVGNLNSADLGGVFVYDDAARFYPAGDVAANLLGFTGSEGEGLYGLERALDSVLAGEDGSATFLMADEQQIPLADSTVTAPVEGIGVTLTIDQDLQWLAQRRLAQAVSQTGGSSGVAVIQDVKTGELLALADYPTYDPNEWMATAEENYGARALMDVYEPGSVEKALTFAALIDAGYVKPRTRITVPPTLPRADTTINDYFAHGTLRLTAAGVLAKSSNIGTALAAEQMPIPQLHSYLRSFGLGEPTGVGLIGESAGLLPDPPDWLPISRDTISFGQGLSVNAVQMSAALSAIANDGVYVEPSLVRGYVDAEGAFDPADTPSRHRVISTKAARQVARMMEGVTGPEGTAPLAAINGYRVAGKTGTAQRASEQGGYKGFTISFAGFAPADKPRFLVYVVIQEPTDGSGGGSAGGPVFHDLMKATLDKYGVGPTGSRSPALPISW